MNIEEVEKKCYDYYIANGRDKSSLDIILCDKVKIKDNEFDLLKDEYSNNIISELINKWNKEKPELTKAIQPYSALDINKQIPKIDPLVTSVMTQFLTRSQLGISKYGTTLEENNNDDFLQHLKEELMDAVLYIEKLQSIKK
jgi:hypothetical protein